MNARTPAVLLFVSVLLIAFVYVVALFTPAAWWTNSLLAIGISGACTAVMGFGLPRRSRTARRIVALTLVLTFLLTAGGFIFALRTPAPDANSRLVLGLPLGAAVILYAVGLVPLIVLPIVYAFTFDDSRPQ